MEDKEYNKMADYYGQWIHYKYLYYLGDVECGIVKNPMSQSQFITDQIRIYENEIQDFLQLRDQGSIDRFKEEIISAFKKAMEVTDTPRMNLYCTVRKLIRDNLILIITVVAGAGFITYKLSKTIMGLIDRSRAKEIYRQIEYDLKTASKSADFNVEYGLTENDIVEKYRNNKSESYFKKHILPFIESFRHQGRKIKRFHDRQFGRDIVKWQYMG